MNNLFAIIFLLFFGQALAQSTDLKPCKNTEGKWGYCNSQGKVVIAHKYLVANDFWKNTNFAVVGYRGTFSRYQVDDEEVEKAEVEQDVWAIINTKGEEIVVGDGVQILNKDILIEYNKAYITKKGTRIPATYRIRVPLKSKEYQEKIAMTTFSTIPQIVEGMIFIENQFTKEAGFINEAGDIVIPFIYKNTFGKDKEYLGNRFSEGLVAFQKDGKAGYLDQKGKIAFILETADMNRLVRPMGYFSEGLALIREVAGVKVKNYYFIDKTGKKVLDLGILPDSKGNHHGSSVYHFRAAIAPVYKNEKWGFIDKTGKVVIDYQFDDIEYKSQELQDFLWQEYALIKVRKNGKYGAINAKGEAVIPIEYESFLKLDTKNRYNVQGIAVYKYDKDGKKVEGYYDKSFKFNKMKL